MEFFGDFLKHFLEGPVDLIIYKDYIVNRRFFIYCSLATGAPDPIQGGEHSDSEHERRAEKNNTGVKLFGKQATFE